MRIKSLLLIIISALASLVLVFASSANETGSLYSGYAFTLRKVVDNRGMVDYRSLKANRDELDSFVRDLGILDRKLVESWSKEGQIAFWINTYNALTLIAIIDNYPIKAGFFSSLVHPGNSIRQIDGVWDEMKFSVYDEPHTLDMIEHKILRVRFDEPRIHMALVCAAMGCPPLRNEPYLGIQLDLQLEDQTRKFLANQEKFRIDRDNSKVYLSAIFDWFADDFVSSFANTGEIKKFDQTTNSVLNFIAGHLNADNRSFVEQGNYNIEYVKYDWSLNELSK